MTGINLQHKRILITGASSGIGRACAICASQSGAECILIARRESALKETLSSMSGNGHRYIVCDLTKDESMAIIESSIDFSCNKISGLVHAAGIMDVAPLRGLEISALDNMMKLNLYAYLRLAKMFSRRKYSEDGSSFVAISSTAGTAAWQGGISYCSSKAALEAATRVLALEYANPRRIRFNTVSPSYIRTPILQSALGLGVDTDAFVMQKQPLGLGEPEQVAWPVCFLLSDAASFITGINLPVDGGYLAQ